MAIMRWDPFAEMNALREQMDRLVGRGGRESTWAPAVDVYDRADALVVRAELPGMKPEDVEVLVDDDQLILRGERRFEERTEDEGTVRIEQRYGRFERSVPLPRGCELESVDATYEDGILEVRIPKAAQAEPRRLTVQRGPGHGLESGQDGGGQGGTMAGQSAVSSTQVPSGAGTTGDVSSGGDLPAVQPDVDLDQVSRSESPLAAEAEVEQGVEPPTPLGESDAA